MSSIIHIPISVMIFTLNEEIHLLSCLASVEWSDDVIVIDSFSTDRTKEICREKGVRFFQNKFTGFGAQRNWALENTNPKYDWALILDADERVPVELANEIGGVLRSPLEGVGAFRIKRCFYMWGRWLRHSSLYPNWVVRLIHKNRVRYVDRGHAESQEVKGRILELKHDLIDENLKGIEEWFERQNRYSTKEAEYELKERSKGSFKVVNLFARDPLVCRAALKQLAWRTPGRPLWYFLYSYFWRLGFLDGMDGLVFCSMKVAYQCMVSVKKYNLHR
ncbi:MAG: glycosyltransferase family 2 protein, partial [Thermodesulfobacteriota bacterium]